MDNDFIIQKLKDLKRRQDLFYTELMEFLKVLEAEELKRRQEEQARWID